MNDWPVPGFTSTGSKRPELLYGEGYDPALPLRMTRSAGCRVWSAEGREYVDCIMALGAVALGYAHPEVTRAATGALEAGVVGPLAPVLEAELAGDLRRHMPWIERVRFLKTGAEACAAAVRLARAVTGRDQVRGCGYHGWLDWASARPGVPAAVRSLYGELPFNDIDETRRRIRAAGDQLACVIIEPVVEREPDAAWLNLLRSETARVGALFIIDEVKTVCRLAIGGATARYGLAPDLVVLGKALANGFPLAAVGGRRDIMERAVDVWISSTLATEFVSLAAARATLAVMEREGVPSALHRAGTLLHDGLGRLAADYDDLVTGVAGIAEMCFLRFRDEAVSQAVAAGATRRGVLFKRSAYNFVSLAHDGAALDAVLGAVEETLRELRGDLGVRRGAEGRC
jgi:glutamate-1-semialdehyde 2,1-aminomutase